LDFPVPRSSRPIRVSPEHALACREAEGKVRRDISSLVLWLFTVRLFVRIKVTITTATQRTNNRGTTGPTTKRRCAALALAAMC
jgi:hypothetical protein